MTLTIMLLSFFVLMALRVPIAFSMAAASVIALVVQGGVPMTIVIQRVYAGSDSFALLAIPLFILAGELMSAGFMTRQLVRFTATIFGHVRAGTGTVDVVSSMLFAGISGSGTADTAAIGSIMIPRMIARGYPRGVAAALEACAGSIGPIIPPSLLMIIYAGLAEVSVARMFLGGFIPGVLIGVGLIVVLQTLNARYNWEPRTGSRPTVPEVVRATRSATLALIAPLIIIGGIVAGVFTATEAGAVAVFYALVISVAKREMGFQDIRVALKNAVVLTAAVMLPVATATLLGWVLARERFGQLTLDLIVSLSGGSGLLAALIIVVFILILGFPVEGLTIMVVFVPILAPLGPALGFDPIHWGVLMVLAMNMAGITPPVGSGIFLSSALAKTSVEATSREIMPFLAIMTVVVLVVLVVPATVLGLPNLIMGAP